MQIHVADALQQLSGDAKEYIPLFAHGSLVLEIYKPGREDIQQPHSRDEVYVVISGNGFFLNDGKTTAFQPGDFLFVAAGKPIGLLIIRKTLSPGLFFMVRKVENDSILISCIRKRRDGKPILNKVLACEKSACLPARASRQ